MSTPHTLAEPIPTTCTMDDLCRILQRSRASIYKRLKTGTFPIPEIEPRDGNPRWAGDNVQLYLQGRLAPARRGRR